MQTQNDRIETNATSPNVQEFVILGIPKSQGRPKFARIGNHVRAYDPKDSRENKENIRAQVCAQNPVCLTGPVCLQVEFCLPRPKNHYGAKGLKGSAPVCHTSRPDTDNMLKGLMDSLRGVVWMDDVQVWKIDAQKRYADGRPETRVWVWQEEKTRDQ